MSAVDPRQSGDGIRLQLGTVDRPTEHRDLVAQGRSEDGGEREVGDAKEHSQVVADGTNACSRTEIGVLKPFRGITLRATPTPPGAADRGVRMTVDKPQPTDETGSVLPSDEAPSKEAGTPPISGPDEHTGETSHPAPDSDVGVSDKR